MILVQATDKLYYKEPIIYGEDWMLMFCDDEGITAGIKHIKSETSATARARLDARLKEAGIEFKIKSDIGRASRYLPPGTIKWVELRHFMMELHGPIPIPKYHHGFCKDIVVGQHYLYAWTMMVPIEIITELMRPSGRCPDRLVEFVLGIPYYKLSENEKRQQVRNEILRQYPNIKDFKEKEIEIRCKQKAK